MSSTQDPLEELFTRLESLRRRGCGALVELADDEWALLQRECNRGDAAARYWLGQAYVDGDWEDVGWEHIERAADAGNILARCSIAMRDFDRAFDPNAEITVPERSVAYWREAAQAGDYVAKFMLAEHLCTDAAEALKLLEESAKDGYGDAYEVLGDHYYHGEGVCRDFTTAAKYFSEALERQESPLTAAIQLAIMHLEGQGVTKSLSEAARYMELTVSGLKEGPLYRPGEVLQQLGEWYAQLAREYLMGDVAEQTPEIALTKAAFWYSYAAELRFADAAIYLASLLEHVPSLTSKRTARGRWLSVARRLLADDYGEDETTWTEDDERNFQNSVQHHDAEVKRLVRELYGHDPGDGVRKEE